MNKDLSAGELAVNRTNAQSSTGPKTEEGKAASRENSRRHGLMGKPFVVLAWERQEEYDQLLSDFHAEHKPSTVTEQLLVNSLAQHCWLADRATTLGELCFSDTRPGECQKEHDGFVSQTMRVANGHRNFLQLELLQIKVAKARTSLSTAPQPDSSPLTAASEAS